MDLPDPIERMEIAAENWAYSNVKKNMFKCCCGEMCKLSDAYPDSNHPYAQPICPNCFKEEHKKKEQ